jgi:hypothetical protein
MIAVYFDYKSGKRKIHVFRLQKREKKIHVFYSLGLPLEVSALARLNLPADQSRVLWPGRCVRCTQYRHPDS